MNRRWILHNAPTEQTSVCVRVYLIYILQQANV